MLARQTKSDKAKASEKSLARNVPQRRCGKRRAMHVAAPTCMCARERKREDTIEYIYIDELTDISLLQSIT